MFELEAIVVEVAEQDGYSIVTFQLSGDGDPTTGDMISIATTKPFVVGDVYTLNAELNGGAN
jgi:hypothetical protein